jgi:hypothetical protein
MQKLKVDKEGKTQRRFHCSRQTTNRCNELTVSSARVLTSRIGPPVRLYGLTLEDPAVSQEVSFGSGRWEVIGRDKRQGTCNL